MVHLIASLATGGAQTMLLKLLEATDPHRFRSSVVSLLDAGTMGDRFRALGIPVVELRMRRGRWPDPSALLRLRRHLRADPPHVLQGWMYYANAVACFAADHLVAQPVGVVWNIRQGLHQVAGEPWLIRAAMGWNARRSTGACPGRILYNSRAGARQHEALGFAPAKTIVIPNGFDTESWRPDADARARLRREWRIEEKALVIGLVARHHPDKGQAEFLQAAAQFMRQNPGQEAVFVLIGHGLVPDPPALRGLLSLGELAGRVRLFGERRDLAACTAALDCAVSASLSESFANVIGEAMACGVPCVVTDVGDSAWVLGEAGWVVPPGRPEAMARALRELADLGEAGRRAMGEKGRQRISQRFALAGVVQQYQAVYQEVYRVY